MAVDTPARISILGGGPIGLEAALYARFLGYRVDLYERGRVCEHVRCWGHVRMFSPLGMVCSTLGRAALRAQSPDWELPSDDKLLTGHELVDAYYAPLAQSDLLVDSVHEQTAVLAVGRTGLLKGDLVGNAERAESPFCILIRSPDGGESIEQADVVIDATGTFSTPNWVGDAGIPALGEMDAAGEIERRLPDILGAQREHYLGKHTLVVGAGYSAATNVVALARLASESPGTQITWMTRKAGSADEGPLPRIVNDRLPERDRLAELANRLAACNEVAYWPDTAVRAVIRDAAHDGLDVELTGAHAGRFTFERVIANVGFRPDRSLIRELQLHECYATEGPIKLAAALVNQTSGDCLDQTFTGAELLKNPEPNFYIIGAKSYGRNSQFLIPLGLQQIQQLFTILGGRSSLDLYSTAQSPPTMSRTR